ncbi:MAG: VOC family protein [Pseudomonadota bacterium]
MDQRVHLISLGVADLDRSAAFYDALGWQRVSGTPEGLRVYNLLGAALGLYDRAALARDAGVKDGGTGAASLGCNQPDRAHVDDVMGRAQAAGATITRVAHETFWGGYGGYFTDPDGHLWEVAYNPFIPLSVEGGFQWPSTH